MSRMVTKDIPINHDILSWARKQANLSPELAAQKAHIGEIKKRGTTEPISPSLRLERWERGIESPTYTQLIKLAKAYRRPILTFFLSEPPSKEVELVDFRTLGNKEHEIKAYEAEFSALVRRVLSTQKSIREILQSSNKQSLNFVGSTTLHSSPLEVAHDIRNVLDYKIADQKGIRTVGNLFSFIRRKAEEKGVFITIQGNLGSAHTNMSPDVFRGFTISDKLAPFVVINPHDTKTANVFTLIHELCHIWLGDTGVSNWNSLNIIETQPKIKNEQFCDQVAAEFLVPMTDLLKDWDKLTIGYDDDIVIERLAHQFKISPIVIARRLLESSNISPEYYWDWYDKYQGEWLKIKEILKSKKKVPLSYKIRMNTKLGESLINTVMNATYEGKISDLDASHILNVKINNFSKII